MNELEKDSGLLHNSGPSDNFLLKLWAEKTFVSKMLWFLNYIMRALEKEFPFLPLPPANQSWILFLMARAPFYLSFPRKILLTLDPLVLFGSHPFTFMWRVVFYLCHLLSHPQNLFRSRQIKWVIFVITGHFPLSAHGQSHSNSTWQVSEKAHLASSCGTGVTVLWGSNLVTRYNCSSGFRLLQDNPQHIKAMCPRQPLSF